MNRQLRRLGAGLMVCFVALLGMVTYVQVIHADELNSDLRNSRAIVRDFDRPRGQIVSADGAVLAKNVPSAPGDRFAQQRQYPEGDLFGLITGYLNLNFGATGVEKQYNDDLSGASVNQGLQTLRDLFVDRNRTSDVTLTVRKDLQQIARDALGDQKGSVVALDPRDGSILAMWGFPGFDPNPLASHDATSAQAVKNLAEADPNKPLRGRPYQETNSPGSTFKVVTGSIGVESGKITPDGPSYPAASEWKPPDSDKAIGNFGREVCGGTLFDILRVSCNSAFSQMGALDIGADLMQAGTAKFGFNSTPPIDLPGAVPSVFPSSRSAALLGQSSIGQFDTRATPLQMALVAAAVANDGVIMTPHVLRDVRDDTGKTLRTYNPKPWRTAISPASAATMRQAMEIVVQRGTGTAAQINGLVVGGKTGTAEIGTQPVSDAWFICYAGPPGEKPSIVVAVLVEAKPGVSEATGGTVAAPIAKQIVQAALGIPGG